MTRNTFTLLALLTALTMLLGAAPAAAGEMLAEIRPDRVDYLLNAGFARYGLQPLRTIGLERSGVCAIDGLVPNGSCPVVSDWFLPGTEPKRQSTIVHHGR